ncbi:MAG: immunoglobulin-like domain-containing protein [Bacteroidia bacterium]
MKIKIVLISSLALSLLIISCKKQKTDTENPIITLNGSAEDYVVYPKHYVDPGAKAKDNIDGDITNNITVINHLDYTQQNTNFDIQYQIKDAAGNNAQIQRIVKLVNPTGAYHGAQDNTSWNDSLKFFGSDSIHIKRFAGLINCNLSVIMHSDTTFTIPSQDINCGSPSALHSFSGIGTIKYSVYGAPAFLNINYTQVIGGSTTTYTLNYTKI